MDVGLRNETVGGTRMSAIIIGIAGGSGSGKTTLTRHLKDGIL